MTPGYFYELGYQPYLIAGNIETVSCAAADLGVLLDPHSLLSLSGSCRFMF